MAGADALLETDAFASPVFIVPVLIVVEVDVVGTGLVTVVVVVVVGGVRPVLVPLFVVPEFVPLIGLVGVALRFVPVDELPVVVWLVPVFVLVPVVFVPLLVVGPATPAVSRTGSVVVFVESRVGGETGAGVGV